MKVVRKIATVCHSLALIGGFVAFGAQWAIFQKGNFSETSGPFFIPWLGNHGIYTSKVLGTAWNGGLWAFSAGLFLWLLCCVLEEFQGRRGK